DTLIPSDSTGPGAKELGVAIYIDRQMAGGYGKGDRLYLEGPFGEGTPEQGYQLPMTPSELIRAGIADVSAYVQKNHKSTFDGLSAKDRAAVMTELDGKKVELPTVPTATFFGLLLQLTVEGYLADPMYGGNKDRAAWKMIGFPGADAMYMDKIEPFRNKLYTAEPKGIQDLV
ncbi:gluconate 2-dehydrogenase subunit 3 family protein, partial [Mesorhizobium sp. M7A.F.Ca.US.001.01.1.1]